MNDSLVTIRVATPDDADALAAGNVALARETESRELDAVTVRSGVGRALADPRLGVYYLAEWDGSVVGQMMITYEWSDWRDGTFWWIQSVYVAPRVRGQGVYKKMHEHIETLARQTPGVCGLRLYVENENTGAQSVYERQGMVRTGYRLYETVF